MLMVTRMTKGICSVLDTRFDTEGILYSGYIPAVEDAVVYDFEKIERDALSELEISVREYWASMKDPIKRLSGQAIRPKIRR